MVKATELSLPGVGAEGKGRRRHRREAGILVGSWYWTTVCMKHSHEQHSVEKQTNKRKPVKIKQLGPEVIV